MDTLQQENKLKTTLFYIVVDIHTHGRIQRGGGQGAMAPSSKPLDYYVT